jgi:predicted lipoprotein with Yx(FWY)xxD motif
VKRTHMLLAAVLAALVSTSAVASAQPGAPSAKAAASATVQLHNSSLGKILVNSSGFTLYLFTRDSRNKNSCIKISGCSKVWPALTSGKPTAGSGVKASMLSTITLPGGSKQVTYAGHPLYTYAPSMEKAETSYVGVKFFGGSWDAVNANGGAVK